MGIKARDVGRFTVATRIVLPAPTSKIIDLLRNCEEQGCSFTVTDQLVQMTIRGPKHFKKVIQLSVALTLLDDPN